MTRTTISLDDRLAREVRERATSEGKSVSSFIACILDDALNKTAPREQRPFRLVTVGGDGPREGSDLDRPRALEVADDEERWSRRRG